MINDLETIYLNIKNVYEYSKDAALIIRDLNIKNGNDISEEIDKYNKCIQDINYKLEIIDIVFRYIVLSYTKDNYDKPIDLDYIFSKIKMEIISLPK